jgi:uncharacterized membrane protein YjjP (DUF1212 family)
MTEKSIQDVSSESLARKQYFLKLATQSLVRNGAIATVLADYVRRLLAFLKMDAEFTYVTGCLTIFMKDEVSSAHGTQTLIIKTGLGYNFDKLEDTEVVINNLMDGTLYGGLDEATAKLEKIRRRDSLYGAWIHPVSWSVIGALATLMLGGKYFDAAVALGTGLVFGFALVACDYYPPMGFSFEFWISYVIAAMLGFVQAVYKDFTFWPPFLASVILILPGFSMSMGFKDVFARQTVVGLTTLFNAAWTALMIGMGGFMGIRSVSTILQRQIVPLMPGHYSGGGPTTPEWALLPIYVVFNFFLNLTFQAKLVEAVMIVPMATAAFFVFFFGNKAGIHDEAIIMLTSLFMGICGHVYAKVAKRSEMPSVYSGVIVLAPGTYGARAAYYSMMALYKVGTKTVDVEHALYAVKQAGSMLTISASIALGLLMARALFGRF